MSRTDRRAGRAVRHVYSRRRRLGRHAPTYAGWRGILRVAVVHGPQVRPFDLARAGSVLFELAEGERLAGLPIAPAALAVEICEAAVESPSARGPR